MEKIWTPENLEKTIKTFSSKVDFKNAYPGGYSAAIKLPNYEELTSHMKKYGSPERRSKKLKYTNAELIEAAKKYKNRQELLTLDSSVYHLVYRYGLADIAFANMDRLGNINFRCIYGIFFPDKKVYFGLTDDFLRRKWQHSTDKTNKNVVTEGGLKIGKMIQITDYLNKEEAVRLEDSKEKEFESLGWEILNIAKAGSLGGVNKFWTTEKIWEDIKNVKDWNDLKTNYPKLLSAIYRNELIQEVRGLFGEYETKPQGYWNNFERCKEAASKVKNRKEFNRLYDRAAHYSLLNGWMDIFLPMSIKPAGYWNIFENVKEEAALYPSREAFKKARGAYGGALRNGWLDLLFPYAKKPQGYWKIFENCLTFALTCKNREEFKKNTSAAYWSRKNGWIDGFFPKLDNKGKPCP